MHLKVEFRTVDAQPDSLAAFDQDRIHTPAMPIQTVTAVQVADDPAALCRSYLGVKPAYKFVLQANFAVNRATDTKRLLKPERRQSRIAARHLDRSRRC
jgi:hypothetical protein